MQKSWLHFSVAEIVTPLVQDFLFFRVPPQGLLQPHKVYWNLPKVYCTLTRFTASIYSIFHKTLPKSSLQMRWILVRFYEMSNIIIFILFKNTLYKYFQISQIIFIHFTLEIPGISWKGTHSYLCPQGIDSLHWTSVHSFIWNPGYNIDNSTLIIDNKILVIGISLYTHMFLSSYKFISEVQQYIKIIVYMYTYQMYITIYFYCRRVHSLYWVHK